MKDWKKSSWGVSSKKPESSQNSSLRSTLLRLRSRIFSWNYSELAINTIKMIQLKKRNSKLMKKCYRNLKEPIFKWKSNTEEWLIGWNKIRFLDSNNLKRLTLPKFKVIFIDKINYFSSWGNHKGFERSKWGLEKTD